MSMTHDIKLTQKAINESHKEWVQNVRNHITEDLGPIDAGQDTKKVHQKLCDFSIFAMTRFNLENAGSGINLISPDELPHCRRVLKAS